MKILCLLLSLVVASSTALASYGKGVDLYVQTYKEAKKKGLHSLYKLAESPSVSHLPLYIDSMAYLKRNMKKKELLKYSVKQKGEMLTISVNGKEAFTMSAIDLQNHSFRLNNRSVELKKFKNVKDYFLFAEPLLKMKGGDVGLALTSLTVGVMVYAWAIGELDLASDNQCSKIAQGIIEDFINIVGQCISRKEFVKTDFRKNSKALFKDVMRSYSNQKERKKFASFIEDYLKGQKEGKTRMINSVLQTQPRHVYMVSHLRSANYQDCDFEMKSQFSTLNFDRNKSEQRFKLYSSGYVNASHGYQAILALEYDKLNSCISKL